MKTTKHLLKSILQLTHTTNWYIGSFACVADLVIMMMWCEDKVMKVVLLSMKCFRYFVQRSCFP